MTKEGYTLQITTNPRSLIYRYRWELYYQHPNTTTMHKSSFSITRRGAVIAGHAAYWRKRVNLPLPVEVYNKVFRGRP